MATPDFARLRVLRDFLQDVGPMGFSMTDFFRRDSDRINRFRIPDADQLPCGTAACMAGWACVVPAFREAGLRIATSYANTRCSMPTYGGEQGFEALLRFFGLTRPESQYVFGATGPSIAGVPRRRNEWGPQDAAVHLDAFIERHDEVLALIDEIERED